MVARRGYFFFLVVVLLSFKSLLVRLEFCLAGVRGTDSLSDCLGALGWPALSLMSSIDSLSFSWDLVGYLESRPPTMVNFL